ncbi:hypothetical protein [Alteriqipengyuania lutimaris]|uniref:Uncharacterized protein n=1 Tax=Alteriqipengyuania lutimaris TaxID=1538146 RepID=A0A395LH21_9SPHN|nr:hypothetical protein [Alteriqipengyuania lutimaris]MBB3035367.1 hypothetical protein [Alteriqipengyuania lutimaris]RDS75951.1 hypothetical protein DL238_14865 [Alteriqipengyuania lutimaris]
MKLREVKVIMRTLSTLWTSYTPPPEVKAMLAELDGQKTCARRLFEQVEAGCGADRAIDQLTKGKGE